MIGQNRRCDIRSDGLIAVLGIVVIGWLVASGAGCAPDHRISLAEFVEMQEEAAKEVPATQPAAGQANIRAVVDRALGPYRVAPGDVLRVTVTGLEEGVQFPPVDVRVDRKGEVDLPGPGAVEVAGLELEDVEDKIRAAYVPYFREGVVHVVLMEANTTGVLVTGAVTQPGLTPLRDTERNLLYAIAAAGGVSELASGMVTLQRLRAPDDVVTLELTDSAGLQAALALAPLEAGDIVTVHAAKPNMVFVGGLVNAPSPQPYPQGVEMTFLQALAAAGGLRMDITPREGTLIRRMADGQDVHVKLDLDRIATGKDPNIALAAGDVIWVPHTLETRIQEWANQSLFFRAGISTTANANYGLNYSSTGLHYVNSAAARQGSWGRGGGGGGTLQDMFDPFGFLLQNQMIQQIPTGP